MNKFKRIHRPTPEEFRNNPTGINNGIDDAIQQLNHDKQLKKDAERELRWKTKGTLGELTERYISEGESEDDAYNTAKQELGL